MLDKQTLSEPEYARLDSLLSAVKRLHYINFIIAGLSISISTFEFRGAVDLPYGGISIPPIQASIIGFFLTIVLAYISDRLFRMAWPWVLIDPRRPPFPWFPIGNNLKTDFTPRFWLILPVLLNGVGVSLILGEKMTFSHLLLVGIFLPFTLAMLEKDIPLILSKMDERGGGATFSIYLLYWVRLLRHISFNVFLVCPILAVIENWKPFATITALVSFSLMVCLYIIRLTGAFIYKPIDKFGVRFNFPENSEHY